MHTDTDYSQYRDDFVTVHPGAGQPEISVVMPIYNCEQFVADAVTSVLDQQGPAVEILISDDASTDNTFDVAYRTVVDYISRIGSKHTVRMRAGTVRLQRDHLHLLANTAACDLICQAHGDDISHHLRCAILVRTFNQEATDASMIFVNVLVINAQGETVLEPKNSSSLPNIKINPVDYSRAINALDEYLIGSNMAWRRSRFEHFPQLTTDYCAYGHDRVMTFRSVMVGGCYMLDTPLLKRRLHKDQWHKELLNFEHRSANVFSYQLIRLSAFSAIKKDLLFLKENNHLEEDQLKHHLGNINTLLLQVSKFLASITSDLVTRGYVNTWVQRPEIPNNRPVDQ
jgi:glycosyltransferase involved in cell wall biosynthesis